MIRFIKLVCWTTNIMKVKRGRKREREGETNWRNTPAKITSFEPQYFWFYWHLHPMMFFSVWLIFAAISAIILRYEKLALRFISYITSVIGCFYLQWCFIFMYLNRAERKRERERKSGNSSSLLWIVNALTCPYGREKKSPRGAA